MVPCAVDCIHSQLVPVIIPNYRLSFCLVLIRVSLIFATSAVAEKRPKEPGVVLCCVVFQALPRFSSYFMSIQHLNRAIGCHYAAEHLRPE